MGRKRKKYKSLLRKPKKEKKLTSLRAILDDNADYKKKKCFVCNRWINKASHCRHIGIDKTGKYTGKPGTEMYQHKRKGCRPGGKFYMKHPVLAAGWRKLF